MIQKPAIAQAKFGLNGYFRARLIRRSGVVVRDTLHKNLILNTGLDFILTSGLRSSITYVAVGTGSSAVDASQTQLDSEVARSNADLGLGFSNDLSYPSEGVYLYADTVTFDYDEANAVITELGGSNGFRSTDGVNTRHVLANPITKTSDERLQIDYFIEVTSGPRTPQAVTKNYGTILGDIGMTYMMKGNPNASSFGDGDIDILLQAVNLPISPIFDTAPSMAYTDIARPASHINLTNSRQTYTNGTFYRDLVGDLPPETVDRVVTGFFISTYNSTANTSSRNLQAFAVKYDNPIQKDKNNRLQMGVRVSVSVN